MKRLTRAILALSCAAAATTGPLLAADAPYLGKWKVNVAKSKVTGDTVTIGQAAGGMMQFDAQGFSYSFKLDGKEYPMPDGGTTAWTATSATVWDVTNRLKGKVTNTYHLVLNGDQLATSGHAMKPDGGTIDFSSTYKRMTGGPGFAGKWMSTEAKMPSTTLEIAANGADGLAMKDETGPICAGQFGGKDTAALGMMAGSKTTFALRKVSAGSFEITMKVDGKPLYVDVYTVSADGKTLTDDGTPANAKQETYKVVFDRQ
jgi:hypothetical protein